MNNNQPEANGNLNAANIVHANALADLEERHVQQMLHVHEVVQQNMVNLVRN